MKKRDYMKAKVKRLEENRTKMFGKFIRAFMNSRRAIKLALNEKKKRNVLELL